MQFEVATAPDPTSISSGSSALLEKLGDGARRAAGGPEVRRVVYALDPDVRARSCGRCRSQRRNQRRRAMGHGEDEQKVYAATSDICAQCCSGSCWISGPCSLDSKQGGGLTALRIGTRRGEKVWYAPVRMWIAP